MLKKNKSKPEWSKIEGNIKWERKPREDPPEWSEFRIEDLFFCHNCKGWLPWFKFRQGKLIAFPDTESDNTYDYMNDDEDRGGRRWACDYCIDKILYDNNIITITNIDGEIIKCHNGHPILR